ncbi:hypothetical protein SODALDRAFT_364335 [Sodiomyces alkalinus F11]|uniref:Uncharacterized protein n=1 Tax=Sodiomyces alkalinus (strain CBS 110278 / VKM F-3762 / F11) TaxID=1314773 RepID=A0A3N2PJG6_SODAK|nr:hypothetical protein SODALDRAFT_364335 [Sodiomyces alkalinus F11]ROT34570.1 hypothetical protein SODALDRAFT_364335 [Sodiomyces alkalinus F11]
MRWQCDLFGFFHRPRTWYMLSPNVYLSLCTEAHMEYVGWEKYEKVRPLTPHRLSTVQSALSTRLAGNANSSQEPITLCQPNPASTHHISPVVPVVLIQYASPPGQRSAVSGHTARPCQDPVLPFLVPVHVEPLFLIQPMSSTRTSSQAHLRNPSAQGSGHLMHPMQDPRREARTRVRMSHQQKMASLREGGTSLATWPTTDNTEAPELDFFALPSQRPSARVGHQPPNSQRKQDPTPCVTMRCGSRVGGVIFILGRPYRNLHHKRGKKEKKEREKKEYFALGPEPKEGHSHRQGFLIRQLGGCKRWEMPPSVGTSYSHLFIFNYNICVVAMSLASPSQNGRLWRAQSPPGQALQDALTQ